MTTDNRTPEDKARQNAIAANCVKGVGAVFILAAPLVAFNVFGLADVMGLRDGFFEYLMGGILLVAGLADFFVIAPILQRGGAPKDGGDKAI
ncbi:MAG: hypothetical protein ACAH80_17130 [Alphaproteobacteria bacterium]